MLVLQTVDRASRRQIPPAQITVGTDATRVLLIPGGNTQRHWAHVVVKVVSGDPLAHVYVDGAAALVGSDTRWQRKLADTSFNTAGTDFRVWTSDGSATPNIHTSVAGREFSLTLDTAALAAGVVSLVVASSGATVLEIEASQ